MNKLREPLGSTQPSPKKKHLALSKEKKEEIYKFWLEYSTERNRQARTSKSRQKPKRYIEESWRMRPEEFQAVLVRTWERIIQKKNAGGELVMKGRKRSLTDHEELLLSIHIKTAGMKGHLITDNAIVTWALQILCSSS